FLHFIWFLAWAVSFDGCTKYVLEQARLGLIHGHMVLRTVGAVAVCALLFPLFAMMAKRLRATGDRSRPVIIMALTGYALAYLVGWISDYWQAYNCGSVDRIVPQRHGYEDVALWVWLIAILVFCVMTISLFACSLNPDLAPGEAEASD